MLGPTIQRKFQNMTRDNEMTSVPYAALQEFAVNLVREVGPVALKYFRSEIPVINKSGSNQFDPVTQADREIEMLIRRRIESVYPTHGIVGEEEASREGDGLHRWIIDPIDGTRAYISGSPMWGILLGFQAREDCILGVMYQPYLNEMFTGIRGGGATFENGWGHRAIVTRKTTSLAEAILYCTHPSIFGNQQDLDRFLGIADRCRMMRYGGDCYAYGLLAYGLIDLVIEGGLAPYDIIPLIPIIEAAGGVVTNWEGGPATSGGRIIAVATLQLHEAALRLLS